MKKGKTTKSPKPKMTALNSTEFAKNPGSIFSESSRLSDDLFKCLLNIPDAVEAMEWASAEVVKTKNYEGFVYAPVESVDIKKFNKTAGEIKKIDKSKAKTTDDVIKKREKLVKELITWNTKVHGLDACFLDEICDTLDFSSLPSIKDHLAFIKKVQRFRLVQKLFIGWIDLMVESEGLDESI